MIEFVLSLERIVQTTPMGDCDKITVYQERVFAPTIEDAIKKVKVKYE